MQLQRCRSSGQFDAKSIIGVLQRVCIMGRTYFATSPSCSSKLLTMAKYACDVKAANDILSSRQKLVFFLFLDVETWRAHRHQIFFLCGWCMNHGRRNFPWVIVINKRISMPFRSSFASFTRLSTKHVLVRCYFAPRGGWEGRGRHLRCFPVWFWCN